MCIGRHTFLLTVIFSFVLPFISFSENNTDVAKKKIKLTKLQVEQSIKLLPFFLKNSAERKKSKVKITPESLNKLAIKYGFKNYQEFLTSSSAIMMAYAYLQLKSNEALLLNQISKLKPKVAKSFKPQMQSLSKSIETYEKKLSPITVKAVIPYMSKIGQILKQNK